MNCITCNNRLKLETVICEDCKQKRNSDIAIDMVSVSQTMISMGIELKDNELTDRAKESLQYWTGEVINGTF